MLICKSVVVLVLCIQFSIAQFPEDDILDSGGNNFFSNYWWNQNGANGIVQENRAPCYVNDFVGGRESGREGTCMSRPSCVYNRGKPTTRSTCGLWSTCCVFEKTTNQTSEARVTYFVNPRNPRNTLEHRLYVKLANKNVCQMRVDIITMSLEKSTYNSDVTKKTRTCDKDYFFIEPKQTDVRMPQICGRNTNQHFYIHLSSTQKLNNAVVFKVNLETSVTSGSGSGSTPEQSTLVDPQWEMKITQLECPTRHRAFEVTPKENRNQAAKDLELLAPSGCLQYFTEPSGTFKNFGYSSQEDTYLNTNQDYAICFKRVSGICGITLEEIYLKMHSKKGMCLNEYLYVPETEGDVRKCEVMTPGTIATYTSVHPGPLYLHFYSAEMAVDPEVEATPQRGFFYNYKINVACTK